MTVGLLVFWLVTVDYIRLEVESKEEDRLVKIERYVGGFELNSCIDRT
jgi:hypothetical protein